MTDTPAATAPKPAYRAYVLTILVVVYTFNFLDRQIIGILAVPIKDELGLTDTQLGLMGGPAFALLYSTLGVPIAWFADRISRTWIMTVALTLWSAATAACGFVGSFAQLFAARMAVGIGEAGGVAPAYSIITDYTPPERRARALAIYSFGIPIGSALGIVFGGLIASKINWRFAFIAVGIAGVLLAPVFRATVREPARGHYEAQRGAPPAAPAGGLPGIFAFVLWAVAGAAVGVALGTLAAWLGDQILALINGEAHESGFRLINPTRFAWMSVFGAAVGGSLCFSRSVLPTLLRKPSFWLLTFGASASSMMGYGVFFWLPAFFVRSFTIDLLTASLMFGAILFVAGIAGIWLGGFLSDHLGEKNKAAYAYVPAIAFLLTAPFYAAGVMAPSPYLAVALFFVPIALGLAWLGPALSAFQHLVPPHMRATASSVFLLINNLLGIAGGIYVLGRLSDVLAPHVGDESLRYSILSGASLYVVAAILFLLASLRLARDWEG